MSGRVQVEGAGIGTELVRVRIIQNDASGGSLAVSSLPALPAGANLIGSVSVDELPAAEVLSDGMTNPSTTLIGAAEMVFNGTTWQRAREANVFKPMGVLLVEDETQIWVPAAGKKFRWLGMALSGGTNGVYAFYDGLSGNLILALYLPANVTVNLVFGKIGIPSIGADRPLVCDGPAAGTITGLIWGTEE